MPANQNSSVDQYFYIPKSDEVRLTRYTTYENIFIGDHKAAFNPKINFSPEDDNLYIKELVGQLISYTSADYLFGEPVKIMSEDDSSFLDETFYPANPQFDTLLYESSLSDSYFGDIVAEVKTVEEKGGKVVPKAMFHDPRFYTVTKDDDGEITQHILSFVFAKGNDYYVQQRVHEVGRIINKLYKVNNRRGLQDIVMDPEELQPVSFESIGMDVEEEEMTGVDDFLVRNIPNMRMLNDHYGMSDYLGKESLMNAYNVSTSFAQLVLEKTADPAMEVPDGVFDPKRNIYVEDLKLFQVDAESKGTTRYVTPETQSLERLFEHRENIINSIALYSEISLSLMGKDSNGAVPDNYRAMKLRFHRTIQKMNRKKRYWEPAMEWILQTSQKLIGEEPSEYTFEWQDGLPDDKQTWLEEKLLEKNLGITSNETLIEEFGRSKGYTEDRIQEEKDRLLKQDHSRVTHTNGAADLFKREVEIDAEEQPQG